MAGKGGKREGAGRPKGALTQRTALIAAKASETGLTPLEIMIANMRHFHQAALSAEKVLEELTAEQLTGRQLSPPDQFKVLLAEVKKVAGLRQIAQECAADAAPYMHSKLSNVTHSGDKDRPLQVETITRLIVKKPDDTNGGSVPPAPIAGSV